MSSKHFTEDDIEAFMEMGNVGAGHAAIALTKLFSREVDMSIPFVRVGTTDEILTSLEMEKSQLVGHELSEVEEPVRYRLSVVFRTDVIVRLVQMLTTTSRDDIKDASDLTDMQKSLVQEVGSTIILRYIAALNKMMHVDSLPVNAPTLKISTSEEALQQISYSEEDQEIILIQLDLFTDEYKFEAHMFIQPHPDSIDEYRKTFHL